MCQEAGNLSAAKTGHSPGGHPEIVIAVNYGGVLKNTHGRLTSSLVLCSHQVNLIRHWFATKKSRDRSFNVYCLCRNDRNLLEFNHPTTPSYSQNKEHIERM